MLRFVAFMLLIVSLSLMDYFLKLFDDICRPQAKISPLNLRKVEGLSVHFWMLV